MTVRNKLNYSRNVKVELWADKDRASTWDFDTLSNALSVGANSTRDFTLYFTPTVAGSYDFRAYIKSWNDGASNYIYTDHKPWASAFTASIPTKDIEVYVHNANTNLVQGAQVKLYDDSWDSISTQTTNSSGLATFNSQNHGTYNYEVYYNSGINEFWGSDENFTLNTSSPPRQFYRDWPYHDNTSFSTTNPSSGQEVTITITVKNDLSYPRVVKVELWVDQDHTSFWDFYQFSDTMKVSGNNTEDFIFKYTPTLAGSYDIRAYIYSWNDGASDYIYTDHKPWSSGLVVTGGNPFPITTGFMLYHSYSDYQIFDGRLYLYNFADSSKTDLKAAYGWNINHAINGHFSQDGTKVVFMGVNSGSTDWDIYLWEFGSSTHPDNLTNIRGNRDEDPKFSPSGNKIVYKQSLGGIVYDIVEMDLAGNIIDTITSVDSVQESMPYYSSDGQRVLYAVGEKETFDLKIIDITGLNDQFLVNEPSLQEFYPITKDSSSYLYARWVSDSIPNDQIYVGYFSGSPSTATNFNNSNADDSDPFPVANNYVLFSTTRSGMNYDLHVGSLSTGEIWSMNSYGVNSTLEELGASYSLGPAPIANLSTSTNIICIGDCISFNDLSTHYPTTWNWTFAGGTPSSSTLQNPTSICYSAAGTYTVELIATNLVGTDTIQKTSYITVNSVSEAEFYASSLSINVSDCISFIDLSIGNPISWNWFFTGGNPSASFIQDPVNICYDTAGLYQVSLDITDSCGTDRETKAFYITVNDVNSPPVVDFASSDTTICEGDCIDFKDLSYNMPTGWAWQFIGGDPNTSSLQNPNSVCYDSAGTFAVELIGSNVNGSDTVLKTSFITVLPTPFVSLGEDTTVCESYTLNAGGGYINYDWSTGDTTQLVEIRQTDIYFVNVTNSDGCIGYSDTISITIDSLVTPSVLISANATSISSEAEVKFTATPTNGGGSPSYQWFLNGNPVGTDNALYTSPKLTSATDVYCIMNSSLGCVDSNSVKSNVISIVMSGIEENKTFRYLGVIPNPNLGKFNVEMELFRDGYVLLSVANSTGQTVYKEDLKGMSRKYKTTIDLSRYSKGIYILKLVCKEGTVNREIIIQ